MKLSNKILMSLYAFVLVTILTVIITFRVSIGDVQAVTNKLKKTEKVIDLEAFENINLTGEMYLEIQEGPTHSLRIEGYDQDDLELEITPLVEDGVLKIENSENESKNSRRFKAFITTPKVKQITLNKDARIGLSNFQLDSLEVSLYQDASCNMKAVDANVLTITSVRNAKVNTRSSDFQLVKLDLEGKSECDFRDITSESITGELKNKSFLRFSGKVSNLNVQLDSEATIRKAN